MNVGDGKSSLFWHDVWFGDSSLRVRIPRLFSVVTNPNASVCSCGMWIKRV